ncbi:MAG: HAD hydrolase-like protein [Candidatus Faecousia sp.]|nr:HAD hydrolase-like protein [Clostridiales bacterium]MDY5641455.1 HAD hydrolase-like protein [Candidatus Faecousia sp.]
MFAKAVLFDLDGTLTDSGEGIINCAVFAMERLGIPVPPREELGVFVGPPLWDTFRQFGVPSDRVDEAVEIFRSRYVPIGKFENTPYSGIRETLEALRAQGRKLYVATSKPEVTAREILEHFDLSRYFAEICGATVDKTRTSKEDVIAYLLSLDACRENSVMVGDTAFDVIGAAAHGIPTIGAAWGYGKTEDMVSAGAAAIARSPEDLLRIIEEEAF